MTPLYASSRLGCLCKYMTRDKHHVKYSNRMSYKNIASKGQGDKAAYVNMCGRVTSLRDLKCSTGS